MKDCTIDVSMMHSIAETESIGADTFDVVHLQVAHKQTFSKLEIRVVVVAVDDVDIRNLHVAALDDRDRNDVHAIAADKGIVTPIGVHRMNVTHPQGSRTCNLDILHAIGLNEGIVHVEAMCPGNTRNINVMTIIDIIIVIVALLGLPNDGTLLKMEVNVGVLW